jgi:hypothetical protein
MKEFGLGCRPPLKMLEVYPSILHPEAKTQISSMSQAREIRFRTSKGLRLHGRRVF